MRKTPTTARACARTSATATRPTGTRSTFSDGSDWRTIPGGRAGSAPIVRKSTAVRSSSASTACRCGITTSCWRASAASAPSAGSNPPVPCASITATPAARCAGSFAAHAISPSASSRTARPACARRPPISRLRWMHRLTVRTRIARGWTRCSAATALAARRRATRQAHRPQAHRPQAPRLVAAGWRSAACCG